MITERDEINIRRTAEQKARTEGRAEGRKEGLLEVAKSLLASGMSLSDVTRHTSLSETEIEALLG